MSKLVWDTVGERLFETGISNVALYVLKDNEYKGGVAWNGVTSINESPSGAEATPLYADNIKYLNLISAETFGCTVEAYMYPDEFMECDGSKEIAPGVYAGQQDRKVFGLAYKTLIGSDADGNNHGYKLHLIYGCQATPSERSYATVNDSPEANTMSWTVNTTPIACPDMKETSLITIDSTKVDAEKLKALEALLWGTESAEPTLPMPNKVAEIFAEG